ncbi:glutamine amidotransferase [Tremella mesenterica]|uniref:Glutamine amidotransferase n=1 Tax=Tremella mesenterica TaxID=5217 RepID=A0A4Q1BGL7_TREME|nr:glutamine amidotransferase [Tremella mesenterica]
MCRFIVYKGDQPIQLAHLVTRPRHSIINQAFESKLRLPSSRPFNADGFGIGWYDPLPHELQNERPCIFKSITPAWSNTNLTRLAEKIRSPLVFAHVRATTMAGAPSEENCHPWAFDKLMWMHNGEISGFSQMRRAMQDGLPDELYLFPLGYTDSEWAFVLFLSKLKDPHARVFSHQELCEAMTQTIAHINQLSKEAGVTSPHLLNFVVTDGETVVATRYINSRTNEASSLFFSSGTSFEEYEEEGMYRMTKADKRERIFLLASEPLTFERSDWMEVRTNTMIVITRKMNLLQIPIIDEFWVPPQDPAAYQRSKDFAIEQGFGHGFLAADVNLRETLLAA